MPIFTGLVSRERGLQPRASEIGSCGHHARHKLSRLLKYLALWWVPSIHSFTEFSQQPHDYYQGNRNKESTLWAKRGLRWELNPGLPVNYKSLARLAPNRMRYHSTKGYLTGLMLHNKYTLGDASLALTWNLPTVTKLSYFLTPRLFALHSAWHAASLLSPPNTREQLK